MAVEVVANSVHSYLLAISCLLTSRQRHRVVLVYFSDALIKH